MTSEHAFAILIASMRTLATQVRLRRLLRAYGAEADRLLADPIGAPFARRKLAELAAAVREAWVEDSTTVAIPSVRRHVNRALAAVDASIAALERPSADPRRLAGELQEAALPLILMLRSLEEVPERQLLDWIGAAHLARTA